MTGIVVGLYGKGGLQLLDLLDLAGRQIWRREDSDITHVEIAASGDPAVPLSSATPETNSQLGMEMEMS